MANVLTAMMQEAERVKRNLKAAPGQIQDQLVNFVADWQGAKLNKAVKGKQPSAEQLQTAIQEIAGNALPGGGAAAGIFIGSGAKGGVFKREVIMPAYKAVREGMDADTLWKKLGVYFGPDGKTRQEISDVAAKLKNPGTLDEMGRRPKVSDYLDHSELAKAYPELMEYSAFPTSSGNLQGYFDPGRQHIVFPPLDKPNSLSTLLHEFQHAIQNKEGFARGGNSGEFAPTLSQFRRLEEVENSIKKLADAKTGRLKGTDVVFTADKYINGISSKSKPEDLQEIFKKLATERKELKAQVEVDAHEMYKRLFGEAEARSTQARQILTAEQRREFGPSTFYDRPLDKLIIKK